jgi:hypothetical protein
MTSKEALERISNIELYHREFDEDEDFDGDWKYLEYTEYDGLVREVYKQEIDTIKKDLAHLEALANVNKKLRIDISNLNSSYLDISKENEKLKKALFITYMKTIDLELLKDCFELKDYNDRVNFFKELTEQEYELLKEVLEND